MTVGTTKSGRSGGAVVHRSALGRADVTEAGGLPATSPARTLVDASALVGYERLCDLVDTALYLRLTTADGIRAAMHEASARPGRAGLGRLRSALEVWTPGPHPGSPRRCA